MKKLKLKFSLIVLTLLSIADLNAQVSGFGTQAWVTALSDPNLSGGFLYTDNVRTQVTGVSGSGAPSCTLAVASTSGFNPNDMALLIQMTTGSGAAIGTHQNVQVTNISPNFTVTAVNGNILSYDPSGGKVQLIKIPVYNSLTLNHGVVTCNPWDGTIGGILCLIVQNNLTINNDAVITVAGLGFRTADAPSVTFASGGSGSPGSIGGTRMYSSTVPPSNYYMAPNCSTTFSFTTTAGTGELGTNWFGARGTNSGSVASYGGSTFHQYLVMGDPGYYPVFPSPQPACGSGKGAGGGGQGGTGADVTTCSPINYGSTGQNGANGGPGGDAGVGGNGGGAMVIKVGNNVTVNATGQVFLSNGQNGANGGTGGDGGLGGIGGNGGQGCCSGGSPIPQGQPGGYGDMGTPGDGGDAGNGGDDGYIWIACQGSYNPSGVGAGHESNNFNMDGGNGGFGGFGGWGSKITIPTNIVNMTPTPNIEIPNACSPTSTCSSGSGGTSSCIEICDIDNALNILFWNVDQTNSYYTSPIVYFRDVSGGDLGTFDETTSKLTVHFYYSGTCYSNYIAYLYSTTDCSDMMQKIAMQKAAISNILIDYPSSINSMTNGSSTITYPVKIYYEDNSIPAETLIYYVHSSANTQAYFFDGIKYCYINACNTMGIQPNGSYPTQGGNGRNAQPGHGGSLTLNGNSNKTNNAIIDAGISWKKDPTGVSNSSRYNPIGASVYPNPANKEFWIELDGKSSQNISMKIYDMAGKTIIKQDLKLIDGHNKININSSLLNNGTYLLELKVGDNTSRFNLVIE
ncbi:MAG: T9SS type A sorting domain-containing protein [Bacteroidia bacterium]